MDISPSAPAPAKHVVFMALYAEAYTCVENGQNSRARKYLEAAVRQLDSIRPQEPCQQSICDDLTALSCKIVVERVNGNAELAIEDGRKAFEILESIDDKSKVRESESSLCGDLAICHAMLGDTGEVDQYIDRGLEIEREDSGESSQRYANQLSKAFMAKSYYCLLYTSPSPRDLSTSRMPSSA